MPKTTTQVKINSSFTLPNTLYRFILKKTPLYSLPPPTPMFTKNIFAVLLVSTLMTAFSLAKESQPKVILLGENHKETLTLTIKPELEKLCQQKEILYALEGILRNPVDEYSIFSVHNESLSFEDSLCFGIEEPISYFTSIALLAYLYGQSSQPAQINTEYLQVLNTLITARYRNDTVNSIFRYLSKYRSEETKKIIAQINDYLLYAQVKEFKRGEGTPGYIPLLKQKGTFIFTEIASIDKWQVFCKELIELVWIHLSSLEHADSFINNDFLEHYFALSPSAANNFLFTEGLSLLLHMRDLFFAINIAQLYEIAKANNANLVASVGALHLEGVRKALEAGLGKDIVTTYNMSNKQEVADTILDVINGTRNKKEPVSE